jgi:FeS assembly SUF system protein
MQLQNRPMREGRMNDRTHTSTVRFMDPSGGPAPSDVHEASSRADSARPGHSDEPLDARVVAALRAIYDPEIPVNIYDLGLIYAAEVDAQRGVHVRMTLTAPACPVAGTLPGQVEAALRELPGVSAAKVELVWDPPWTQERMSEDAKLTLGLL